MSSPGHSISDDTEKLLWRGKGEGNQDIEEFLQQKALSEHQRLLLIKENQMSQVKECSVCAREDARVWAHWNHSFDTLFSSLGPVSCVFSSWVSSGCMVVAGVGGCSLMIQRRGASCLHSEFPWSLLLGPLWCDGWMSATPFVYCFSSVQLSRSVMSDSLWPHGLQHPRPPCPSPTPKACSNSRPLSR